MRDAGEKREIALRDTERLVGAIGLAPGRDFLSSYPDDSGYAAALVHRPAQPIERRRVGVMDSPMLGIGRGIARPRDLVGLGEGDGFGETGRGLVGHGEMISGSRRPESRIGVA